MLLPNLTFLLLIIVEGCAGPLPEGQGCSAKNFSIRVPYEKLEQCEAARKAMVVPEGTHQYIRGMCLAVPKPQG
jgi:hypothetical protein